MKEVPRIIGKYVGDEDGPLLLITAGVHGNEPSGVRALEKIFSILKAEKPSLKGVFLGLSGNRAALQKGIRFIDEDLNRTWTKENLQKEFPSSHEQKEMREIIEVLGSYPAENFPDRYFVDCHTTSSDSLPYISVQEVGKNDAFARKFPVNIVRGFSDIVDGSIDKYFSLQGFTGFTFEAGKHDSEAALAHQEGIIWLALKEANKLDTEQVPVFSEATGVFSDSSTGERKIFKILYRHGLQKEDQFVMEKGFSNFESIENGRLLAVHNGEELRSTWDASIFMPLYQSQGNDGFFIIEEVK